MGGRLKEKQVGVWEDDLCTVKVVRVSLGFIIHASVCLSPPFQNSED